MVYNRYTNGKVQAKVFRPGQGIGKLKSYQEICFVHASWAEVGVRHSQTRLILINEVFEFIYKSINHINRTSRKKEKKKEVLNNAIMKGWGHGIQDTDDLLHHLAKNNGDWLDDTNTRYYMESFLSRRNIQLPLPIYHFANAMSEVMDELEKKTEQIMNEQLSLTGSQVTTMLDRVSRRAKAVEHLVWIDKLTNKSQSGWTKSAGRVFGKVSKYADVITNLDSAIRDYKSAMKANGQNPKGAIAFAALTTAISCVPVLGSFYAEMARMIPTASTWMKSTINRRNEKWRRQLGEYGFLIKDV